MNELKERLDIEKQGWIENYMKKQVQTATMYESLICLFKETLALTLPRNNVI